MCASPASFEGSGGATSGAPKCPVPRPPAWGREAPRHMGRGRRGFTTAGTRCFCGLGNQLAASTEDALFFLFPPPGHHSLPLSQVLLCVQFCLLRESINIYGSSEDLNRGEQQQQLKTELLNAQLYARTHVFISPHLHLTFLFASCSLFFLLSESAK